MKGTDKHSFQCCLDRRLQNQYLRAPQDHSGGIRIDPKLQNPRAHPLWMDGLHFSRRIHLALSFCCRRRSHCQRKRKQAGKTKTCFSAASNQSSFRFLRRLIILLKKESPVCCHTCSSGRKCTMRSIGFGLKLAQAKRTSTFADSTNEILYHKKTLEPQAVPKVTLQCKFARDRSGWSSDTTEANMFQ